MAEKLFKVVATSKNLNSFGMRGAVVIARDGSAWELMCSNAPSREALKDQVFAAVAGMWRAPSHLVTGVECPRRLSDAPRALRQEVWPE
jgi:hypothetical protein